jgi:hypothetical protein
MATASRDLRVAEERHQVLASLLEQQNHDLETLRGAAIVACNAVSPAAVLVAPAEVEEHLHTLPARITSMISLGIRVGATRALATAQLWSGDTDGLA